jgi:HD-GYP domain-containing protein (c-di-GMP phosphodiesterase class II)
MPTATMQSRGYLPVATAALCPASVLDYDLYIQRPGRTYTELYRGRQYPLEPADLDRLREDGVDRLYIRLEDANSYRDYLCQHVLHQQTVPLAARMQALREVTRAAFAEALAAESRDKIIQLSSGFARDLVGIVTERPLVFHELFSTIEHDYYTFTHVCNVSTYCIVLANALGGFDESALTELAAGALLHDIGKRHVSVQLLNKPGKLTENEWDQIRQHPIDGFRELVGRQDVSWAQLMMVYQHHERLDGTGYPAGVVGEEIHPWARLCAVVDVFDAMTCQRPYRKATPLAEACAYLDKHAGSWFDKQAAGCWTKHVRSLA